MTAPGSSIGQSAIGEAPDRGKNGGIGQSSGPDRRWSHETPSVEARSAARRTIFIVIFLLMFNYLVLPRLAGATDSADLIRRVNPLLLLLGARTRDRCLRGLRQAHPGHAAPTTAPVARRCSFRIQLSTKAVTNLVPGGSAAGGTVGYRLLTECGRLATGRRRSPWPRSASGSAVVLNLLLWLALLISIPLHGFNPLYLTAAIVGLVLLLAMAALVLLLMKGTDRAERVLAGDRPPHAVRGRAHRVPVRCARWRTGSSTCWTSRA